MPFRFMLLSVSIAFFGSPASTRTLTGASNDKWYWAELTCTALEAAGHYWITAPVVVTDGSDKSSVRGQALLRWRAQFLDHFPRCSTVLDAAVAGPFDSEGSASLSRAQRIDILKQLAKEAPAAGITVDEWEFVFANH